MRHEGPTLFSGISLFEESRLKQKPHLHIQIAHGHYADQLCCFLEVKGDKGVKGDKDE